MTSSASCSAPQTVPRPRGVSGDLDHQHAGDPRERAADQLQHLGGDEVLRGVLNVVADVAAQIGVGRCGPQLITGFKPDLGETVAGRILGDSPPDSGPMYPNPLDRPSAELPTAGPPGKPNRNKSTSADPEPHPGRSPGFWRCVVGRPSKGGEVKRASLGGAMDPRPHECGAQAGRLWAPSEGRPA